MQAESVLSEAVARLLRDPPKKQHRDLAWRDVPAEGDAHGANNVLLVVRRVRNNLFHGGKAKRQSVDGKRDDQLVGDALLVLDRALDCHPSVRALFLEV